MSRFEMEESERIFTRSEASALLPTLRPLLEDLRDVWRQIKELNPEIEKIRKKAMLDAFSPHGVEYVESVSHLMIAMGQVRKMGVIVKDLDKGLIDFPYQKDDHVVYLAGSWARSPSTTGMRSSRVSGGGSRSTRAFSKSVDISVLEPTSIDLYKVPVLELYF